MDKIRRITRWIPPMVLIFMASVLLWGFVFTRITDTAPEKKLVLCVDAPVPEATALAVKLEETKGSGIRMIQVRPFTYAMLDSTILRTADAYIVKASNLEAYRAWFAPLPATMADAAGEEGLISVYQPGGPAVAGA